MKNKLIIDVDTESPDRTNNPVIISKPSDFNIEEVSSTKDGIKGMIMDDMVSICNGLGTLIKLGEDNDYFSSDETAKMCVKYLEDNFINNTD
jgi:hypothetical protein